MDLSAAVTEWRTINAKRLELDKLSKELKKLEEVKKGEILNQLTADGLDSVKLSGVGHVYKVNNLRVRCQDAEKICRRMFEDMKEIEKKNETVDNELEQIPLSDALLFQRTPLQDAIKRVLEGLDFADWNEKEGYAHDVLGVTLVHEVDLNFRSK